MGYDTFIHGDIHVTPAVPESALKHYHHSMAPNGDVLIVAGDGEGKPPTLALDDQGEVVVIEGTMTTKIWPAFEEPVRNGHELAGQLRELVAILVANGARTFTGALYCSGEDVGDLWRVRVDAIQQNEVVEEHPKLVWPNGDEGGF